MTDDDVVIRATNLGKSYTRYTSRAKMLLDRLQGTTRRGEQHWALRNVSFEVKRGEFFGVIGKNGAGKSTLLQLLAGVLQPTEGTLEIKGRALALLELGASFDPEATGLQNVRTQLAMLGIPRDQWDTKTKEIAAFADIGDAINQPVKTYSSGMFVRLAFATNTCMEPDVLLVDEALSVGDIFFQQKCYQKMESLRLNGCTIMLVSHAIDDVRRHCRMALLLGNGAALEQGKAFDVVQTYYTLAETSEYGAPTLREVSDKPAAQWPSALANPQFSQKTNGAKLVGYFLGSDEETPSTQCNSGDLLHIFLEFQITAAIAVPVVGIQLYDREGILVHGFSTIHTSQQPPPGMSPGSRLFAHHTLSVDLAPGEYTVTAGLQSIEPTQFANRKSAPAEQLHSALQMHCWTQPFAVLKVVWPASGPVTIRFDGLAGLPSQQTLAWKLAAP